MQTSFLTVGGWDEEDYNGEIRWMNTGDGWNQTLTEFKFDGETIAQEYDLVPIQFEVGYPYIGMSQRFFDKISQMLTRNVRGMTCERHSDKQLGLCKVPDKTCEEVNLS